MTPSGTGKITLREVWQLALPHGTSLAGGRNGLHREVEWASALGAAFPLFGRLEAGYMVLADLELARSVDPRITFAYLADQLSRVGVVGVALSSPVGGKEATLADELGLPVLVLPAGSDLHGIERAILRVLVDYEGQLMRREAEARTVLQRAFGASDMDALTCRLGELTSSGLSICDRDGIVISSCDDLRGDAEPLESVYPISVAGRRLGELALHTPKHLSHPMDAVYAREAAVLYGIEMLQHEVRREAEERLGAELVEQLLEGQGSSEALALRMQRQGYEAGSDRSQVVVAVVSDSEGAEAEMACIDRAASFRRAAQRDGAQVLTLRYGEHRLVFCSHERDSLHERLRFWLDRETASIATGQCVMGVSRIVQGIPGLRTAVRQALDAVALREQVSGLDGPYHYEDLGLYRLLIGLRNNEELRHFYGESLGPLEQYDEDHATDLVLTLEAYFRENANASQTARALHVHRNTLAYRLRRIAEITGLDLEDAEARLILQLALKVHNLRPHVLGASPTD